jgi:hypothetical protein
MEEKPSKSPLKPGVISKTSNLWNPELRFNQGTSLSTNLFWKDKIEKKY